jgi:hypothetical protein
VTNWLGMRKNALKAVYYREWRMNRFLYLGTAALMVLPWCLAVFADARVPHQFAREFLTAVVVGYAHGDAGFVVPFGVLLAGVLALIVFWNDHSRGGIDAALQGPLSRRALVVGKLTLGLITIWSSQVCILLIVLVTAWDVGQMHVMGSVIAMTILTLVSGSCLFTLTLAFSGAMGSPFFIALAAVLWLILPGATATIVTNLTYLSTRMTTAEATAMNTTRMDMHWLSPLVNGLPTNTKALLYAAYFALWTVAAVWAALVWWSKVPYERLHAPLYFPWLWNGLYTLLAMVTGFFLAYGGRALGLGGWTFPGLYGHTLILAIPSWFLWRWIWVRLGRSGLGIGPTAEF